MGFTGDSVGKEAACNARDPHSILELGGSPEEGNGMNTHSSLLAGIAHEVATVRYELATNPPNPGVSITVLLLTLSDLLVFS